MCDTLANYIFIIAVRVQKSKNGARIIHKGSKVLFQDNHPLNSPVTAFIPLKASNVS